MKSSYGSQHSYRAAELSAPGTARLSASVEVHRRCKESPRSSTREPCSSPSRYRLCPQARKTPPLLLLQQRHLYVLRERPCCSGGCVLESWPDRGGRSWPSRE